MYINKVVNPIKGEYGEVFCKIKYENKKLSITGVEGPNRNGNCKGSCGQIYPLVSVNINTLECWSQEKLNRFNRIWDRWHLNDMNAGTVEQETFLATSLVSEL